ncbi:hypothetical protein [Ottowia sp. VDI28]|uniref:hypothetical protein n=1 Tax=Ottowia sp. VDI28 TaxID=3133968 RepID=UPI003C2EC8CF
MKKSLLALGAVAALGGLGFSGAANAVWVVGDVNNSVAQTLNAAHDTGVGHILVTPYFSTTNNTGTLLSVVNTDTQNGKAVKVRFRGAANSDDVFDFTVLMSPGDVWTASVSQGADGRSRLITPDNTCVLPNIPNAANTGGLGQPFTTTRLDQFLDTAAQAAHTQEGYVEWLNMADIPEGTPLYEATKHVNNVAPCTSSVMNYLMRSDNHLSEEAAASYGLTAPTGQLMGNWTIYNSQNVTSYGGPASAIVAVDTSGTVPAPAAARLFFAPQIGASSPNFPAYAAGDVVWSGVSQDQFAETADPLLTTTPNGGSGTTTGLLPILPFDLPDLSTPYVKAHSFAASQSTALSYALSAEAVMNEWTAGADGGVDFSTDWVFSQPTRRYHAAINYRTTAAGTGAIVHNSISDDAFYKAAQVEKQRHATYGDMLCLKTGVVGYKAYNREESTVEVTFGGGEWSPGVPVGAQPGFCGEVALMQFGENRTRALNGQLSVNTIKDDSLPGGGGAGWMNVTLPAGGLPVIGYAANTFNTAVGNMVGNYGDAITHRYKRPTTAAPVVTPPAPAGE